MLCLASGIADLKARLARIVVGYTYDEKSPSRPDSSALRAPWQRS